MRETRGDKMEFDAIAAVSTNYVATNTGTPRS